MFPQQGVNLRRNTSFPAQAWSKHLPLSQSQSLVGDVSGKPAREFS